jgi:hypothetical protein
MSDSVQLPDHLKEFIDNAPWRWARTYAHTWPHYYALRKDLTPDESETFTNLVRFYQEHGYWGSFWKKPVKYLDFEGYTYWCGTDGPPPEEEKLMNRCEIEESFMYLAKHGLLKERLAERRRRKQ